MYIKCFQIFKSCLNNGNSMRLLITKQIFFKGVCQCRSLYVGVDCSHAISTPPGNLTLPGNGLCETSKRACAKTNIFGHFWSETVYAKLERFEVRFEVTNVYNFKYIKKCFIV